MRIFSLCAFVLLMFLPAAAADEVTLTDGTVVQGAVESVKVEGRVAFQRGQLLSVRFSDDRDRIDAAWIEQLLRFALERERVGAARTGSIGVYVGRGVSAASAMAVVRRLDERKRAPRLLLEGDVTREGLAELDTIVVPGGWAPSQLAGLGSAGQSALRAFVMRGGGYLGICAGGYLVCTDVTWAGQHCPYPVRLVAGTASGPVVGRAAWPTSEVFTLSLGKGRKARALYAGGSSFDVEGAEVIATYPGGAVAAIHVASGKGRLVLTGAHVEFDERKDSDLLAYGGWAQGLKPGNGHVLETFLKRLKRAR